jgi:hypothetical protein
MFLSSYYQAEVLLLFMCSVLVLLQFYYGGVSWDSGQDKFKVTNKCRYSLVKTIPNSHHCPSSKSQSNKKN